MYTVHESICIQYMKEVYVSIYMHVDCTVIVLTGTCEKSSCACCGMCVCISQCDVVEAHATATNFLWGI